MIGYAGVQTLVAAELAAHLPARLALLSTQLGPVLGGRDATPAFVASGQRAADHVGFDDWPFLLVVAQGMPQLRGSGMEPDGTREYRARYTTRVFAWVRGNGYEEVDAVRARLVLAAREVLLTGQQLAATVRIDETTWDERYSDVGTDDALATSVGAAWLGFVVEVQEDLAPRVPGVVLDAIDLRGEVAPLPLLTAARADTRAAGPVPHPALD